VHICVWYVYVLCSLSLSHVIEFFSLLLDACSIRLQSNPNKTSGPLPLMKEMVQKYGFRSIYKGYAATLFREIPSYAAYFAAYEVSLSLSLSLFSA
jgi:solute carrier family 25 (mitochondrial carnitine/acylcarnitine transporter), member 20/29